MSARDAKPSINVKTSLLEAMPDAARHWGPSNAVGPGDVGHAGRRPIAITCDRCGREFLTRAVKLAAKAHPWTCPECIAREVGSTAVPLRCADNGMEFPSIRAAASWLASETGAKPGKGTERNLGRAVKKGWSLYGYRFEKISLSTGKGELSRRRDGDVRACIDIPNSL